MEDFLGDPSAFTVEPSWSKRDDTWFCSFGASPEAIPREALRFKAPLPYLLKPTTSNDVLTALDYSKFPVWYNLEEHWLSWIPLSKPDWSDSEEDPLAYLIDVRPVPTQSNYTFLYGTGSNSDNPMEPKEVICSTLATTTSWYNSNRWTGASGDVPRKIDETSITMVYSSEETWFQTLIRLEDTALHEEDRAGATWKNDWDRSDWFFQNKYAGKRGDNVAEFLPTWDYAIGVGRFKAAVTTTDRGTTCTFFCQNPLQRDEPPFDRVQPSPHIHELQSFSLVTDNEHTEESDIFHERQRLPESSIKIFTLPGLLVLSTLSMGPAHVPMAASCRNPRRIEALLSLGSEDGRRMTPFIVLSQSLEGITGSPRRRSQSLVSERTLDQTTRRRLRDEYAAHRPQRKVKQELTPRADWEMVEHSSGDHPSLALAGAYLGARLSIGGQRERPPGPRKLSNSLRSMGPIWDLLGTRNGCRALFFIQGFTKFEEMLEVAIHMAFPFSVYIRRSDVHKFSRLDVSSLDLKTLGALYAPGYVDLPLVWTGPGGGPAVYGGVCRFVAEVYDERIVYRYAQGPSLQVSEFDAGESRRINGPSGNIFYTTDRISNSEIYLLLGHIAGMSSSADRTLWPTPEVFECESPHMRGYLSEGSYRILANLRRDIVEQKRYKWCTYSQWKEYFRVGAKGDHEPKSVPSAKDFEAGVEMIRCAFPINWLNMEIGDIVLPEEFEPHAQRD
ncbi:hypothetical protein B0H13DRAFT_2371501 [Mycena leptocephala]|nr:hypothetical protein B0H13DRAFT_2371501 [Mycena leptocephala]